jgi:hypothetical protein
MRTLRSLILGVVVVSFAACGGGGKTNNKPDAGDTGRLPKCNDGIDNDGDGKTDYPADPGCYAPNQDDETDDCPNGPTCPQCSNGQDDDMNGSTDYPNDPGCAFAADSDEYTENPVACGAQVHIKHLPLDGHVTGMLASGTSNLQGACGGPGTEDVYELRIQHPKVVVATTDGSTTADTVLYIRSASCMDPNMEVACDDDISTSDHSSTVTASITQPGTYYLVVDTKSSTGGQYDLHVQFLVGEGDPCSGGDDCGPGLVCRVPLNGTTKVCAKHVCQDGVDDDGDGKNDYPDDPGCGSATDDDETDDCPSGPNCPECGNGSDDDHDNHTDYPADTQCLAASSTSEACPTHEVIAALTQPTTMGDTSGATSDFDPTCASATGQPDLAYRLDLPALSSLSVAIDTGFTWFSDLELLDATCGGTAVACSYSSISKTNVTAGTYYLVVDGDYTNDSGPFTLTVSGTIKNGSSCESALAQSGALTCALGYACKGTMGSRTCQPAKCSNGMDDDGDGKIDYPFDPGCANAGDDDEADPASAPACSNSTDDDTDGATDFPADFGCTSAADTSEVFCTGEMDPATAITTKTTTGMTTSASNDFAPSCTSFSTAPEVTYGLELPVPVQALDITTTGFDTVLSILDAHCGTPIACNDEDPNGTIVGPSAISLTNVAAGGYAIMVDGYSSYSGTFTLTVHGTVAPGTSCASPLFSGAANAVLSCPSGTTCTGTPKKCQ